MQKRKRQVNDSPPSWKESLNNSCSLPVFLFAIWDEVVIDLPKPGPCAASLRHLLCLWVECLGQAGSPRDPSWHKGKNWSFFFFPFFLQVAFLIFSNSGANAVALGLSCMEWSRKGWLQFSPRRVAHVWGEGGKSHLWNGYSTHIDSPHTSGACRAFSVEAQVAFMWTNSTHI